MQAIPCLSKRIVVALSGGIDSAVAALLLKRQGYGVEAVFMQNWDARIEFEGQHCTVEADFDSAHRVAKSLKIPLHRVNFVRQYWHSVFEEALRTYSQGNTPNPDILCNREIKFGSLLQWCTENGFSHMATGHYAQIVAHQDQLWIGQAADLAKDQSYFLAGVDRSRLSSVLFPVGRVSSKRQVREIALGEGWDFLLSRPESMGICFVGKRRRFAEFLGEFITLKPGDVVQVDDGKVLGQHLGVEGYTIGQHLGIGGMPARMFVVRKCLDSGTLFVSPQRDHPLLRPLTARFLPTPSAVRGEHPIDPRLTSCSIRASDKTGNPLSNLRTLDDGSVLVEGKLPFMAPAPGQMAVLYEQLYNNLRIVRSCGPITSHQF